MSDATNHALQRNRAITLWLQSWRPLGRGVAERLSLAPMAARFANSYIDRLFAERDFVAIHHLISVVSRDRSLPEEFWLFCRVFEWAPSRSGVWQYYEGLPETEFERISQALDRFGLTEIAQQYRTGKSTWDGPDQAADLDKWLDAHASEIHSTVFDLIAPRKDCLRDES